MTWRDYHEATKHTVESIRRSLRSLDWANQPDPFRHYEGVPVLDLPADPPPPDIPTLKLLRGASGHTSVKDGSEFLSQLLFYSAAISASKIAPASGERYALRVNPSSGNLHPTEFHFFARGLKDWPDGLYHYRPSSHMAEQRAIGDLERTPSDRPAPIVFVLTSIAWREAWKYGDRAFRYCLHDIGHAWQCLELAARSLGCQCFATGCFNDDELSEQCRLSKDEWPMLRIEVRGESIPTTPPENGKQVWFGGRANRISVQEALSPLLEQIHAATKIRADVTDVRIAGPAAMGLPGIPLPSPASALDTFGETARKRRSAIDFAGGLRSISLGQLAALLDATSHTAAADFATVRFIQLYLYVHRVDGLPPGVYRHWPDRRELEEIKRGDQRVIAAGLSLGQQLAGNACVAFSMIGDFDRAVGIHGDRGYRYVHYEAGAIGQRLYVAAEALGFAATGIGAFYDEAVHRFLNIRQTEGQVVYHFATGYPISDPRISAQHPIQIST
jgi:SagB-type dehydrogenase family enzyme